jgi:hypothetical protein
VVAWEAGSLPNDAMAPMSLDRFIGLALGEADPAIDPAHSILPCSKEQFRDAAARATEEVADALHEVTAEMLDYFSMEDLLCFHFFAPFYHALMAAKHGNLTGRLKEQAVTAELTEHVEVLVKRCSRDLEGSFEGKKVTVPRRMSRTLMLSQLSALHRLMLRHPHDLAYMLRRASPLGAHLLLPCQMLCSNTDAILME